MTPSSGQNVIFNKYKNINVQIQVLSPLRLGEEFCFYRVTLNTVGPLLSGHPGDFENWPLNRG